MIDTQSNLSSAYPASPVVTPSPQVNQDVTPLPFKRKPKVPFKMILGSVLLVITLIGGAAGLYLSQRSQELRQDASGGEAQINNIGCTAGATPGAGANSCIITSVSGSDMAFRCNVKTIQGSYSIAHRWERCRTAGTAPCNGSDWDYIGSGDLSGAGSNWNIACGQELTGSGTFDNFGCGRVQVDVQMSAPGTSVAGLVYSYGTDCAAPQAQAPAPEAPAPPPPAAPAAPSCPTLSTSINGGAYSEAHTISMPKNGKLSVKITTPGDFTFSVARSNAVGFICSKPQNILDISGPVCQSTMDLSFINFADSWWSAGSPIVLNAHAVQNGHWVNNCESNVNLTLTAPLASPSPTPTPSASPSPTPIPQVTPTPTTTPSLLSQLTPSPTPTPSASPSPTPGVTPTPTTAPTNTPTTQTTTATTTVAQTQPELPETLPVTGSEDVANWVKAGIGVLIVGAALLLLL